MYNNAKPTEADLPSSSRLMRSTLIALAVAAVLLVAVVLPAEHAIDPTGIGRVLGLTEMGEIKAQLATEAATDAASTNVAKVGNSPVQGAAATAPRASVSASPAVANPLPVGGRDSPGAAVENWRDEMEVVLQPGEGAEIKLVMKEGEQAQFSWSVQDGTVNFDAHADGAGKSISYEKGRDARADEGVLEAAFDGNHGWFWRNRGKAPVTVVLRVKGQYSDIKRVV